MLYARKSTEQDERQSQSIESQRVRATELAKRIGVRIVEVCEESKSAKEPGRPVFNRILDRIDAGEIDGIIAWHPDRLARNEVDGSALTYRLRKGVLKDLAFVEYSFINSPEGIMMLQIVFSQTQYQVSKLSIEVTRGLEDKVALGWNPHRAPFGYLNDTHLIKGQRSISPDPERFPLLQRAWHLLADGTHTTEEVRCLLNDSWGFRTPVGNRGQGGKPLARSSIYRMLSNPFYAGLFVHGGKVHQGAHIPMVTMEEFRLVQEKIRREKLRGEEEAELLTPLGSSANERPFTGLIRCGRCGSMVTVSVKVKPSGKRYVYYHCSNSRGICPRGGVREEEIQLRIGEILKSIQLNDTFHGWALKDIEKAFHAVRDTQDAQSAQRRRAIEEIRKLLDGLTDMRMRYLISDEEYQKRKESLQADKERLEQEEQLGDTYAQVIRDTCVNIVTFARNAATWLEIGTTSHRRLIAQTLVSNWRLDGKNLVPELKTLLRPLADQYPILLQEMGRIEQGDFGSHSTKKEAIASIRQCWSCIRYS